MCKALHLKIWADLESNGKGPQYFSCGKTEKIFNHKKQLRVLDCPLAAMMMTNKIRFMIYDLQLVDEFKAIYFSICFQMIWELIPFGDALRCAPTALKLSGN